MELLNIEVDNELVNRALITQQIGQQKFLKDNHKLAKEKIRIHDAAVVQEEQKPSVKAELRTRLVAFYTEHNPEKLHVIDSIMLHVEQNGMTWLNRGLKKMYGQNLDTIGQNNAATMTTPPPPQQVDDEVNDNGDNDEIAGENDDNVFLFLHL